jgi:putative transposase
MCHVDADSERLWAHSGDNRKSRPFQRLSPEFEGQRNPQPVDWLAVAVAKYYHQHPHEGLDGQTPLRRWREGVTTLLTEGGSVPVPRDPRAYLVDFLPVLRRSLQRNGITIDHLTYFSSALRAWITARDRPGPLLIRRDPRDLSRVFVLDPQDDGYLEVPTRDLSRPAISLWEHRLARRLSDCP